MGKIRVRTLGDEAREKEQKTEAKNRKVAKDLKKGKGHIKGVGLKGGQQVKVIEGVELKPEIEALLKGPVEKLEDKTAKPKKVPKRVRSKRYLKLAEIVDKTKLYPLQQALQLLKETSTVKFDATVEAHLNLNPELFSKEKPTLSGSVNLPHGTGKKRTIAIADEELISKVASGKIEFDVLVAHPSIMPKLAKVAKILGPKGLMPNPKNRTVTVDPEKRAKELAGGELNWKTDAEQPLVHQALGKVSFAASQLQENLNALVKSIGLNKIVKITFSSSMGPGIKVDLKSI